MRKRMSSSTDPPAPADPAGTDPVLVVISHSGLFYWWPVWLVGLVLSGLTWLDGGRLAVVPEGTKVAATGENQYQVNVDRPDPLLKRAAEAAAAGQEPFPVRVSANR